MSRTIVRKIAVCLAVWLIVLSVGQAAAQAAGAGSRLRAGVLGFEGNCSSEFLQAASDQLTSIMHDLNRFNLIERSRLDAIIAEHRLNLSGIIDSSTTVEIGRILGLDIGVMGTINSINYSWESSEYGGYYRGIADITVTVVNMETGEILGVVRYTGLGSNSDSSNRAMHNAIRGALGEEMGVEIASLFSLQSQIIEVDEDTVFINIGSNQGVKEKAYFSVQRPSVTHLAGKELAEDEFFYEEVGRVRVDTVNPNISRAEIMKNINNIRVGDYVEELPDYGQRNSEIMQTVGLVLGVLAILALSAVISENSNEVTSW